MADMIVYAAFTKNSGEPATGLALADIDLYLTAVDRATGAETIIWSTVNPTVELTDMGHYLRVYSGADLDLYNYHARASYTGITVLDSDHVTGAMGLDDIPIGTAKEWTYRVFVGINTVEGVETSWYANANETDLKWHGYTDTNGWAKDAYGRNPRLDVGRYYIFRQHHLYSFTNPDIEDVI